jgi:hypothetical protein
MKACCCVRKQECKLIKKRTSSAEARLLNNVALIGRGTTDELPAFAEKASAGEGGETGIRTLDTLWGYTHFPGVPLQPLEHLSVLEDCKGNHSIQTGKTFSALPVVTVATSSIGMFFISAIFCAIMGM